MKSLLSFLKLIPGEPEADHNRHFLCYKWEHPLQRCWNNLKQLLLLSCKCFLRNRFQPRTLAGPGWWSAHAPRSSGKLSALLSPPSPCSGPLSRSPPPPSSSTGSPTTCPWTTTQGQGQMTYSFFKWVSCWSKTFSIWNNQCSFLLVWTGAGGKRVNANAIMSGQRFDTSDRQVFQLPFSNK